MSNLEEAKESLEKAKQLKNIINPPPKNKRAKLPLARDINMIERLIKDKLETKEGIIKETLLKNAQIKWNKEITEIHTKAVALRKELESLNNKVKTESNGYLTIDIDNAYSSYWGNLPKTMTDAFEDEMIETDDDNNSTNNSFRQKIDAHMLDIKLGIAPISDVKALLEDIDQIK